jgi:acyl carrier protein
MPIISPGVKNGRRSGKRVGRQEMQDEIREILAHSGRLAVPVDSLDDEADLFAAGLDSLAIVKVLMSIEERFDIELPDEMLSRRSFSSIATIKRVVADLAEGASST